MNLLRTVLHLYCRLGTIDYLAPEILKCPSKSHPDDYKHNPDIGYTNKVDCWSIGVLAYELLVGRAPFAAVRRAGADFAVFIALAIWGCSCVCEP